MAFKAWFSRAYKKQLKKEEMAVEKAEYSPVAIDYGGIFTPKVTAVNSRGNTEVYEINNGSLDLFGLVGLRFIYYNLGKNLLNKRPRYKRTFTNINVRIIWRCVMDQLFHGNYKEKLKELGRFDENVAAYKLLTEDELRKAILILIAYYNNSVDLFESHVKASQSYREEESKKNALINKKMGELLKFIENHENSE